MCAIDLSHSGGIVPFSFETTRSAAATDDRTASRSSSAIYCVCLNVGRAQKKKQKRNSDDNFDDLRYYCCIIIHIPHMVIGRFFRRLFGLSSPTPFWAIAHSVHVCPVSHRNRCFTMRVMPTLDVSSGFHQRPACVCVCVLVIG